MYATTRYNFVRLKATHKISPLEELVGGRSPPSSSQRLTGMSSGWRKKGRRLLSSGWRKKRRRLLSSGWRTKERRLLSSHTSGTIQTCFNCCKLSTENLELCSSVDNRGEDGGVGLVLSSDGIFFISNVNGLLTGTLISSFSDYKETKKTLYSFLLNLTLSIKENKNTTYLHKQIPIITFHIPNIE